MKSTVAVLTGLFLLAVSAAAWAEESGKQQEKAPTVKKDQVKKDQKKVDPTGGDTDITKRDDSKKSKEKKRFPLGGSLILTNTVGLGTFTAYNYSKRYEISLSMRPRYYILNNLYIQARLDMSFEVTKSSETADTKQHQLLLSDTIISVMWKNFYTIPVAKIAFDGYMDILAPTSLTSRYQDKYLSLRWGFNIKRGWSFAHGQRIDLLYGFRFDKHFHKSAFSNITAGSRTIPTSSIRVDEGMLNSALVTGGNNLSFGILNRFNITYTFLKKFYVMLDLMIANSWTYNNIPQDVLSSEFAKGGRGQRDTLYGTIEFGYEILKYLSVDIGIYTAQPPKTSDGKSFRFPFFDFRSSPNNYTVYYFDIVASF